MAEAPPTFLYHPDSVATGAIKRSDRVCLCRSRARGWIYDGPAYAVDDIQEALCPWCSVLDLKDDGASFLKL